MKPFVKKLKEYIDQLTNEDRLELFHEYCIYCEHPITSDFGCQYCYEVEMKIGEEE